MVLATMADSEREELEKLIEDWNASRLDMFTISKPDVNLEFSGHMRFYFQEPGSKDTKVSTKVLRVKSSDTTEEVMKVLVSKFHPDMKMLTMPNYSLYEVHETGSEAHKLELDQRPLYVQLYWQQYDRDGRFLLKSEDDLMTKTLFEEEESARNPDKQRNSKQRQSKRGAKNKRKKETEQTGPKSLAVELFKEKPESSFTRSKSNPEIVMKIQRKKKLEDRLKKLQDPETSGGGGGPLRIFAESLQPENPYKTILCASNDTTETVLKDALEKYEVPPEEMDQYCLTMVTITPGNHSDPESSSGIKERVVPDKDCPAAIAASWPESNGELRFYLKKKENMPKRKQPRKRSLDHHGRTGTRPGPAVAEHNPPPTKETTFDVTEHPHSPTEKEPVSPAVHVVDASRDLPATLEFRESGEDAFFAVVVSEVNGSAVNFKLAPTFTLYMCCRYRLSPKFRPDFPPNKRREKVTMTANKVANMMWQTVKENTGMAGHLAFWMANSSEFLHFLKQDVELSGMTEESQKILALTTQQAFRLLVQCIKAELQHCLPAFLDPSEESELDEHIENGVDEKYDAMEGYQSTERSFKVKHYGSHGQPLGGDQWIGKRKKTSRPILGDVLHTLKAALSLLRRCRVNPALTIQLFSQVFHFINMWLFNRIVLEPQLRLCTRLWGVRLIKRLRRLHDWAEVQGLELAAECHLARISQAALLLQIPKNDSTAISSHCYKLNSLQLRQLLELYQPERDEAPISLELIEKAVSVAESTADEIARSEGQEIRLEEEPDLHLPFLLPDDGYSSENTRGVPPGLKEFLDPLITPGLCRLTIQPKASGLWTVHFKVPVALESPAPEVIKISINKGNKGMGVSIVAAKGAGQENYGIYVKEVIDGGPAALDGRLKPGDQIIDVNGESLVGVQQEDAVKIMVKAGSVVHMTVAKNAAVYQNGLVELLNKSATNNKVESPTRPPENRNLSPLPSKKDTPRAPPRYRPPQESPQRSPLLNARVQSESEQKPTKPEAPKRRSPYDGQYNEWKNQMRHEGPPEQPPVQAKAVVEYKLDEPPPARKPIKAGVTLPYANPVDIQRRQKEMQQRKVEDERQGKESFDRERMKRAQEEREEADRLERERIKREEQARRDQERQERERVEKEQQERQRIEREQQERQRIEREQLERQRIEKEQQERQRIEREQQERQRIEREQQERQRIEREQQERQRIEREQQERQRREREELERKRREEWEKRERERIEREEMERRRQEEWKKQEQERIEREQREKEEREKRMQQENAELDEMSRRERELEMMLEQKRREKEKRLKELQRQIQEEQEEAERMEQEMERLRRGREERKEPQRINRPPVGNTQVHYVNDQGKNPQGEEIQREVIRNEDIRSNRPSDYGKRGPMPNEENKGNHPVEYSRRPPPPTDGNYNVGKRQPILQDIKDDSFDMDEAEVERRFQQRLAQEDSGKSEVDGGGFVKVIRVPVQQNNWESRGNARDMDDRPRARVDWQREEERNRKEQQWRREQDEQLVRDFQQNEAFRQQPPGAVAEPVHAHQGDWEKDEELRRQREEDDRLREARANQLRNRIIERPDDDEDVRDTSYGNGRTRRVKFASVRTEIIQPSPDAQVAKPGVKFVHDGKVEDSDDEEFPRPPPPLDEEDAPPPPPPPQNQGDYYQRPLPPPKPQNLMNNGGANPPEYHGGYRDNEHIARARVRLSDEGYATYPGRQQHNNNYPVPQPRGVARDAEQFSKSPSPDQAKLPFKDKIKVFNENTPPTRQTHSKWEQRRVNGDSL